MSLLSKTKVLVDAIYNDFNRFFDQDEMVVETLPAFEMSPRTAAKVKEMESALNGKSNTTAMSGGILTVVDEHHLSMKRPTTVGEARAIIQQVKEGKLELE